MNIPDEPAALKLITPVAAFIAFDPLPTAYIPTLFSLVTLIVPWFSIVPSFDTEPVPLL